MICLPAKVNCNTPWLVQFSDQIRACIVLCFSRVANKQRTVTSCTSYCLGRSHARSRSSLVMGCCLVFPTNLKVYYQKGLGLKVYYQKGLGLKVYNQKRLGLKVYYQKGLRNINRLLLFRFLLLPRVSRNLRDGWPYQNG